MAKKHHGHKHRGAAPGAPMPGPHEFSAEQERAMRHGVRASRMPPPDMGAPNGAPMPGGMGGGMGGGEPDDDDMGGM